MDDPERPARDGRPTRRALLSTLAVGSAALTGCLGTGGRDAAGPTDDGSGASPTAGDDANGPTPTGTPLGTPPAETPPPGECRAVRPEPTGTASTTYPERPDELTVESVGILVEAFEEAYVANEQVAAADEPVDRVEVSVGTDGIDRAGSGYVVAVSGHAAVYYEQPTGGTPPTPTPMPHGDLWIGGEYYVTERFVLRDGRAVACWE